MTTTNREEALSALAYKFWEEEGRPEGRAETHWLRAVSEFIIPTLPVAQTKHSKKSRKR